MPNEIDILLSRTEERIARLRDDLRFEERYRERLLKERAEVGPVTTTAPSVTPIVGNDDDANQKSNGGHRPQGTIVPGSLISHVVAVLTEAGRGMKAREISDRVLARGFNTTAKGGVPVAVSTALAHNAGKLFTKIDYGVYDLIHRHEADSQQEDTN